MPEIKVLMIAAMMLAAAGAAIFVLRKNGADKRTAQANSIVQSLADQLEGSLENNTITGLVGQTSYCVQFSTPSERSILVVISIASKCPATMNISQRGIFHTLGERVGIIRKIHTASIEFSERYHIVSPDPARASRFLSLRGRLNKISEVLSFMPGTLSFESDYIAIQYVTKGLSDIKMESFTPRNVKHLISLLADLSENMSKQKTSTNHHYPETSLSSNLLFIIIMGGVLIITGAVMVGAMHFFGAIDGGP